MSNPSPHSFGLGFRVPCLIVSPFVKKGVVQHQVREHSSIARFCEEVIAGGVALAVGAALILTGKK